MMRWHKKSANMLISSTTPTLPSRYQPLTSRHSHTLHHGELRRSRWTPQIKVSPIKASSKGNPTVTVAQTPIVKDTLPSGSDVVKRFYEGINDRDLATVEELIADECIYEDLIFPRPFVGRKDILEFFGKFTELSRDLKFAIEDISTDDSSAVGVTWRLEWKGRTFPFSKGCSFYRLVVTNGKRQIIYGRDSVEPAIKPGETALAAIRGVTWLLQQFPQLADRL